MKSMKIKFNVELTGTYILYRNTELRVNCNTEYLYSTGYLLPGTSIYYTIILLRCTTAVTEAQIVYTHTVIDYYGYALYRLNVYCSRCKMAHVSYYNRLAHKLPVELIV